MKNVRGMIYVTALLAIATYLEVSAYASAKNRQVRTNTGVLLEQARTQAVVLEAVTMAGCPPCKRLKKETIPTLVAMGYDVVVANRMSDTRGTTLFPTLYYLDAKGNVVFKQIGFRTAEEVIKHLKKTKYGHLPRTL